MLGMKVAELIDLLKAADPDAVVLVTDAGLLQILNEESDTEASDWRCQQTVVSVESGWASDADGNIQWDISFTLKGGTGLNKAVRLIGRNDKPTPETATQTQVVDGGRVIEDLLQKDSFVRQRVLVEGRDWKPRWSGSAG